MERINVTKTFMPPREKYEAYLREIWERGQITNQGPLLLDFEKKVKKHLGIGDFHFVTNGTVALQIALKALDISEGEVITTPFSYVATVSAILWERCQPVFVDIEPDSSFCIDADKIEEAITPQTKAILAVHVFGNPCDVEKIDTIARKHNIKVIYDAAHAFGVEYKGKSLLDYGDISACSFHATKLFHTVEGGSLTAKDKVVSEKVELIKKFGHNDDHHYMLGINAKASELQAAMGLCNLEYVDDHIDQRGKLVELYSRLLDGKFQTLKINPETKYNNAYFPVVMESESQLLGLKSKLEEHNVFPRRYFYPSLNTLPYITGAQNCAVSESIASRIMCLPLYVGLEVKIVRKICEIMNQ